MQAMSVTRSGALIEPHLAQANRLGRPRTTDLREAVNALLYMNRTG